MGINDRLPVKKLSPASHVLRSRPAQRSDEHRCIKRGFGSLNGGVHTKPDTMK
jgi:hypothetical protein